MKFAVPDFGKEASCPAKQKQKHGVLARSYPAKASNEAARNANTFLLLKK